MTIEEPTSQDTAQTPDVDQPETQQPESGHNTHDQEPGTTVTEEELTQFWNDLDADGRAKMREIYFRHGGNLPTESTTTEATATANFNADQLIAENRKYRTRAQKAESQRDDAEQRYQAILARSVTDVLTEHSSPKMPLTVEMLNLAGIPLDFIVDANGTAQQDIKTRLADVYKKLGIEGAYGLGVNPAQGRGGNTTKKSSWMEALRK